MICRYDTRTAQELYSLFGHHAVMTNELAVHQIRGIDCRGRLRNVGEDSFNPIYIGNCLKKCIGAYESCVPLQNGNLVVTCTNPQQVKTFMSCSQLTDGKISMRILRKLWLFTSFRMTPDVFHELLKQTFPRYKNQNIYALSNQYRTGVPNLSLNVYSFSISTAQHVALKVFHSLEQYFSKYLIITNHRYI